MAMQSFNGADSPMDGHAAADAAAVSGASAAAATAPVYEWRDITCYCKNHPQKRDMNDYALKYYRWCFEDPAGVPCIRGCGVSYRYMDFDLSLDTWPIFIAHHQEDGPAYWFDDSCEEQPWSWRHLFGSLTQGPAELWQTRKLFQSPVVRLSFVAIPDTIDQDRMFNEWEVFEPGVLPPVWDFVVGLQDGTMWRLHPRSRGNEVDIALCDGRHFFAPAPAKGAGKLDEPGTNQCITQAHYTPDHGQMHQETGLALAPDQQCANHLTAPAVAGFVQLANASAPAVVSQKIPFLAAPVAAGNVQFSSASAPAVGSQQPYAVPAAADGCQQPSAADGSRQPHVVPPRWASADAENIQQRLERLGYTAVRTRT